MFADQAKIYIRSGKGGDGHVSFRRELYVPAGGPDGGDGGRGGDLIFEVDPGINTLNEFRHIRKYCAEDGEPGGKKRCHGRDGKDLIVKVPAGTIVKEASSGQVITDMSYENTREVVLKGGRGGKGNQHYATPTMQAPKYAQPGKPAMELEVILELKTIADVGLVGFPNVGKSTFLSRVTNARPKIANYHFTTLNPNLGVVDLEGTDGFVIADSLGLLHGLIHCPAMYPNLNATGLCSRAVAMQGEEIITACFVCHAAPPVNGDGLYSVIPGEYHRVPLLFQQGLNLFGQLQHIILFLPAAVHSAGVATTMSRVNAKLRHLVALLFICPVRHIFHE